MAGLKPNLQDATTAELIRELNARGLHCLTLADIAMLTEPGYMAEFYRFAQFAKNYREAWEMTEGKLQALFLLNRYTNYSSMRCAVSRYRRKKMQKK